MKISKEALRLLVRALIAEAEKGVVPPYYSVPGPPVIQPQYPQPAVQKNPYDMSELDDELKKIETIRKKSSALEEACEFILQAGGYPGD